jgi:hypothetical protein
VDVTRRRPVSFVARRLLPLLAAACLIVIAILVMTGVRPSLTPPSRPADMAVSGVTIAPAADGVMRVTSLRGDGPEARAGMHVGDGVSVDARTRIVRFHRTPGL